MFNGLIDKLTNGFTETIFYKKSNELEKRIDALTILLEKYPDNKKLMSALNMCKAGLQGEQEIEYELSTANIGMYVLHDVNMAYQDLKAQVDYIIITPAYVYFVECKRMSGNIFVDANGNFNRVYYKDSKKVVEGMYSPLTQAQRHFEIFKKIWIERNTSLIDKLLRRDNLEKWYKPIVIFANSKNILDLKNAPIDYSDKVMKSENLVALLKRDYKECDKDLLINEKGLEEVAYSFMAHYNKVLNVDYIKEYEDMIIGDTRNGNEDKLREELLEFRKEKASTRNIPEDYVFTDDELEVIIKIKPKTKDELANAKVLSDVKLKYHGDEIVSIIVNG